MINNSLEYTIEKLVYYIKKNGLINAQELKKFVYIHNLSEEKIVNFKNSFNKYGEMNIYNCIFLRINKKIKNKEDLIKMIKGL